MSMPPYLLTLILIGLAGPTQIVDVLPTAARCIEVAGIVSAALSNANKVAVVHCEVAPPPGGGPASSEPSFPPRERQREAEAQ